jgi:hypothetical protein
MSTPVEERIEQMSADLRNIAYAVNEASTRLANLINDIRLERKKKKIERTIRRPVTDGEPDPVGPVYTVKDVVAEFPPCGKRKARAKTDTDSEADTDAEDRQRALAKARIEKDYSLLCAEDIEDLLGDWSSSSASHSPGGLDYFGLELSLMARGPYTGVP